MTNQTVEKDVEQAKALLSKAGEYLESKDFDFGDMGNYYPEGVGYAEDVALTLSRGDDWCMVTLSQVYGDFSEPHLSLDFYPDMKECDWQHILDSMAMACRGFASAKLIANEN